VVVPSTPIRLRVTAHSDVTGASMYVDGELVPADVTYPVMAHYHDDDYNMVWYTDYRVVQTTYAPTGGLSLGSHTVSVITSTTAEGTFTESWGFSVDAAAPAIVAVSPVGATTIPLLTPIISVTAAHDDSALTATMTVDGAPVASGDLLYDPGTRTFSYLPPLPLSDNTDHVVSVTVRDSGGMSAARTWMFRTEFAPWVTALVPANGSTVNTARPTIGFAATDAGGEPLTVVVKLDGTTVFGGSIQQGVWRWTPPGNLANATHAVRVEVTDVDSNTSVTEWAFDVVATTSFTGMSPAPGSTVLTPGEIGVDVDSDSNITGARVWIDGGEVLSGVEFQATGYEDNHTGDWIVTDPTAGSVRLYYLGPFGHGMHEVTVQLTTSAGGTPSQTWFFNVDTAPVISAVVPAQGVRAPTLTPVISASVVDDDATFTCAMTVDGAPVTPTWDAGTKTFSYTPSSPFGDNTPHTASVTVTDPDGFSSVRTWDFSVHLRPYLHTPVPTGGSTVSVGRPNIGLTLWDDTPGTLELRFFLDRRQVFDGVVVQGAWRWNPAVALAEGAHTARAVATNANGVSAELEWSFSVVAGAPLTSSGCTRCHDYTTHPANGDCATTCHPGAHYIGSYDCGECHGGSPDHSAATFSGTPRWCTHHNRWDVRRACTACHPSLRPMHDPAAAEAKHVYAGLPASCRECHSDSLITEHERYPAGWGTKYDCAVCHDRATSTVLAAIAANDVSCDACHANADHMTVHDTTLPPNRTRCYDAGCHAPNLITEHVGHGVACSGCHVGGYALSGSFVGASVGAGAKALPLSADKMPPADGTAPKGMISAAIVFDPADAVNDGNTACDACHPPNTHGNREDCETCHGPIPPTTDGSEPTATTAPDSYAAWSNTGANADTGTPHKGYTTSTNKCLVCHAVHNASTSGESLLRGRAEASCEYCHVYTAVGGVVIYGGDASVYYATHDDFSHNRTSDSACRSCHSVHGARTLAGANSDKILWDWAATGSVRAYAPEALVTWPDPRTEADDDGQITAWCTGCHSYYATGYETVKTHVMRPAGSYGNSAADPAVQGTQIAYRGSTTCRSCHDAGGTDLGPGVHASSFPHSTPGYYRFMTIAASMASPSEENTAGMIDGLCLKCHLGDFTTGVGLTY
jgi:hypothetical protein